MLYWIYEYWNAANQAGDAWAHNLRVLNLLQYLTIRAGIACLLTFVLSVFYGPWLIRKLVSLKVGQPIRSAEEVHKLNELHGGKAGTPTMGGIMILGTVFFAVLLCGRPLNPFVAVTTCVMLALGLLGFLDDYAKVKLKSSDGVSGKTKLFWQFFIGTVAAVFLYFKTGEEGMGYTLVDQSMAISQVTFPLFKEPLFDMGWLCIPFFVIIIMGCSNAVKRNSSVPMQVMPLWLRIRSTSSVVVVFPLVPVIATIRLW